MKMSEMETIWFLKIINIYHLEIRILTCMVFGILYFSLKIWNRWKWIKVTDILLYSYFYFYWKSKDSFWVISDPNNTVSWLINACYTITYDSDCSIWQYLYLALSSSQKSTILSGGFKFQTDHCYYMYDSGQIFPSLWTPVSSCKSK